MTRAVVVDVTALLGFGSEGASAPSAGDEAGERVPPLRVSGVVGCGEIGSMGRRGNPYDNATPESFMKPLKVEAIYPMAFDSVDDVVDHLPHFIEETYNRRRLHSALGYLSPQQYEDQHVRYAGNRQPDPCPPAGVHSTQLSNL
jgi:hypothetical protein